MKNRGLIYKLFLIIFLFSNTVLFAQNKQVSALRIDDKPVIDGIIDEAFWQEAQNASDFFEYEPNNGNSAKFKTEIKIAYDDNAIYFAAKMYDPSADSIFQQLGKRDNISGLNADVLKIDILPFNDGLNCFTFKISASGVQGDEKNYAGSTDESWDAVWQSATTINDEMWIAELAIPYSALRFPKSDVQTWGLNFWRQVRRYREWDTWTLVDKTISNNLSQAGTLNGIKNIEPPLRLELYPYMSYYVGKSPGSNKFSDNFKIGTDLKLGLTDSYTLDMILIPDFGQTESDDEVLNLGPFETKYNEKRQFFTEGTELFNKGGLLYSRRIGATPRYYNTIQDSLNTGDSIINNPRETRLINASKISGRNKRGLGLGVFNAITANSYATVIDSLGNERQVLTQNTTNFNEIVIDKNLKNNSYVSLVNTNVAHVYGNYIANVTGGVFSLRDKENRIRVSGNAIVSQKYQSSENSFGKKLGLAIAKTKGNFLTSYSFNFMDDKYDPNDMGYNSMNNIISNNLNFNYNIYQPFWKLLRIYNGLTLRLEHQYNPLTYTEFHINAQSYFFTRSYLFNNFTFDIQPIDSYDFYESRNPTTPYKLNPRWNASYSFSSDFSKKFALDGYIGYLQTFNQQEASFWYSLTPLLQVGRRTKLSYSFSGDHYFDQNFYVTNADLNNINEIIFGARNQSILTQTIDFTYAFFADLNFTFRLRHYWNYLTYSQYFTLNNDGSLSESTYNQYHDMNFNNFTIDMGLRWRFLPGSEFSFVWKNNIATLGDAIPDNYFRNFEEMINNPQTNTISVKLLFFINYQTISQLKKNR